MKKIFILLFIIGVSFYVYSEHQDFFNRFIPIQKQLAPTQLKSYRIVQTTIGRKKYYLFVADSEVKRQQGLSGVEHITDDQGMVFSFPQKKRLDFWMKGMKFNLDFIFINGQEVVDLIENVSPSTYPAIISGSKEGDKAIELPAGQIPQSGIEVGDSININL